MVITADELRSIAKYDRETGEFVWLENDSYRNSHRKPQKPATYFQVTIRGRRFLTHRLAWLWVHGKFPEHFLDHVNGDIHDNRLCNLREANNHQNLCNRGAPKNNSTGYKGVSVDRGRYMAKIAVNGKQIFLGRFDDPVTAHEAYCAAALRLHGEFARAA